MIFGNVPVIVPQKSGDVPVDLSMHECLYLIQMALSGARSQKYKSRLGSELEIPPAADADEFVTTISGAVGEAVADLRDLHRGSEYSSSSHIAALINDRPRLDRVATFFQHESDLGFGEETPRSIRDAACVLTVYGYLASESTRTAPTEVGRIAAGKALASVVLDSRLPINATTWPCDLPAKLQASPEVISV